jgi:hypothetical protein
LSISAFEIQKDSEIASLEEKITALNSQLEFEKNINKTIEEVNQNNFLSTSNKDAQITKLENELLNLKQEFENYQLNQNPQMHQSSLSSEINKDIQLFFKNLSETIIQELNSNILLLNNPELFKDTNETLSNLTKKFKNNLLQFPASEKYEEVTEIILEKLEEDSTSFNELDAILEEFKNSQINEKDLIFSDTKSLKNFIENFNSKFSNFLGKYKEINTKPDKIILNSLSHVSDVVDYYQNIINYQELNQSSSLSHTIPTTSQQDTIYNNNVNE